MSIDRASIIQGPARIDFDGQSFYYEGTVNLKPTVSRFEINTDQFGKVDERISDKSFVVSFKPSGRFNAALAAVMWKYASYLNGTSIFGATDTPLVIHTFAGRKFTVLNAALTTMPNMSTGVATTLTEDMEFTGLLANNTDPSDAASYYTDAAVPYDGNTDFDTSEIITPVMTSSWGSVLPWSSFNTQEGWNIALDLELSPVLVDGLGTVDMILQGLQVTATSIPVGPTVDDLLIAQGINGTALGSSVQASAEDLIISGTGLHIEIYNSAIVESEVMHSSEEKALGSSDWIATRTITAGVADPLFYIGTTAPV
jgi:hypothetical protein